MYCCSCTLGSFATRGIMLPFTRYDRDSRYTVIVRMNVMVAKLRNLVRRECEWCLPVNTIKRSSDGHRTKAAKILRRHWLTLIESARQTGQNCLAISSEVDCSTATAFACNCFYVMIKFGYHHAYCFIMHQPCDPTDLQSYSSMADACRNEASASTLLGHSTSRYSSCCS